MCRFNSQTVLEEHAYSYTISTNIPTNTTYEYKYNLVYRM